jgi:hypothetical protein
MSAVPRPRSGHRPALAALAVLAVTALAVPVLAAAPVVGAPQTPQPLERTEVTEPVTGMATWFTGIGGSHYGGCGIPEADLDTPNYVALNVYNTPGDYVYYSRPMDPEVMGEQIGMFNNGRNCGRWIRVTIKDYCEGGANDGAAGLEFCRDGGTWIADDFNGGTLDMIVADSCGDDNAWCRESPYHIDLARPALRNFVKDGVTLPDLYPDHWNNRMMEWHFIPAPNYTGDISIGFLQGAETWWAAIGISHLANGIHGVDYYADGAWSAAKPNADMGQSYIVQPTAVGGTDFSIRIRDVTDELINDGRVYNFSLPQECSPHCVEPFTKVSYTTSAEPETPLPADEDGTRPTKTCTASSEVTDSWPDGYQSEITVTGGPTGTSGWTVSWDLAEGQILKESWGGVLTSEGSRITVRNESWGANLDAGETVTFGVVINGPAGTPELSCTSP